MLRTTLASEEEEEEESSGTSSSVSVHRLLFESVQAPPLLINILARAMKPPALLLFEALIVKENSEIELNGNDEDSDGGKVSFALVLIAL